jgi:four helix bundle protein
MHNYRSLDVWKDSIDITTSIYSITQTFPKFELFGIISQIQRCAVSIPSNIAEGAGRNSDKEFNYFLSIALGSSFELETQLIISNKLGYFNLETLNEILNRLNSIQKMLHSLKKSLEVKRIKKK